MVVLPQDLLFRFVSSGERVADVLRRLARTVEERAEKEVVARVAGRLLGEMKRLAKGKGRGRLYATDLTFSPLPTPSGSGATRSFPFPPPPPLRRHPASKTQGKVKPQHQLS